MKRILVTGATGVLGSALTRELCEQGHEVVAVFLSNQKRAEEVEKETGCTLWKGDMSDEKDVREIFERFQFDAIVHLAGWNRNALLFQTSARDWNETVRSHLESSFLMCRAALEFLPPGGQVVLVSSRVGLRGNVGQCAYASAKSGVFGLMKSAALEGKERGICINALCPGFAPASAGTLATYQQQHREREELLPENDAPQSFAAFTSWFLSSNLKMTGQILRPDCRI